MSRSTYYHTSGITFEHKISSLYIINICDTINSDVILMCDSSMNCIQYRFCHFVVHVECKNVLLSGCMKPGAIKDMYTHQSCYGTFQFKNNSLKYLIQTFR